MASKNFEKNGSQKSSEEDEYENGSNGSRKPSLRRSGGSIKKNERTDEGTVDINIPKTTKERPIKKETPNTKTDKSRVETLEDGTKEHYDESGTLFKRAGEDYVDDVYTKGPLKGKLKEKEVSTPESTNFYSGTGVLTRSIFEDGRTEHYSGSQKGMTVLKDGTIIDTPKPSDTPTELIHLKDNATQLLQDSASAPTEPMPAVPSSWDKVREATNGTPRNWEELEKINRNRQAPKGEEISSLGKLFEGQEGEMERMEITESEFDEFVKTGKTTDEVLNKIAQKFKNGIPLSPEEISIYTEYNKKIEEILNDELLKEKSATVLDSSAVTQPMPIEITPPPLPKTEATPPPLPIILEEQTTEVKEEIKNLSPEEREKIGWGLGTLGFKVEKAKNDFFAATFDKPFAKLDKKSTLGRFCKELSNSFVKDSKEAEKKAKAVSSGKEKHRLSNAGLLVGNVLKYGRIVADVTGASIANPFRYVMMGGMAGARISEAGKEARFKNEEVIEQTRIQDAEKAYDEAMAIYMKAQDKEGVLDVSADALKNVYLTEMPRDLQQRLENPDTANSFIQKIIKTQIGFSLERLQNKLDKIELGGKSKAEKEKATEKLLKKWEKDLKDYDRAITQYGTVDSLAMAGRYAEKTSKGVVLGMQIETALVSGSKLWETVSHLWHHSSDIHTAVSSVAEHHNTTPKTSGISHPAETTVIEKTPEVPVTPTSTEAVNNLLNKEIKFEHGKGGIAAVFEALKLKNPETTYAQAVKEAIKFGLYDPNNPNESALIQQGSTLKFDNAGNLIFHDVKTGEEVTHYAGKMFDSHLHTTPVHVDTEHIDAEKNPQFETKEVGEHNAGEKLQNFREQEIESQNKNQDNSIFHTDTEDTHTEGGPRTTEDLREEIIKKMEIKRPSNVISVGTRVETGTIKLNTNTTIMHTDTTLMDTGTTEMGTGGIRVINGPLERFDYNVSEFAHTFPGLSRMDHLALETHPEFGDNDFQLSGEKLMDAYHASEKNISFLFSNENNWSGIKNIKAEELLENTVEKSNPAITKLSDYVHLLRNFTELKPEKTGFLLLEEESAEHYIARALQKASALEKLKDIQESIRK